MLAISKDEFISFVEAESGELVLECSFELAASRVTLTRSDLMWLQHDGLVPLFQLSVAANYGFVPALASMAPAIEEATFTKDRNRMRVRLIPAAWPMRAILKVVVLQKLQKGLKAYCQEVRPGLYLLVPFALVAG